MANESSQALAWGREGVDLCRQGEWVAGIELLVKALATADHTSGTQSSLFYSYLGYGIAKVKGRRREGLAFCEQAVKIEFFQPENQLNLARTYMLLDDRTKAVAALRRGLKIDPHHAGLLELAAEIGERRRPVIGFLDRANFLNVGLGKVRHSLSGDKK